MTASGPEMSGQPLHLCFSSSTGRRWELPAFDNLLSLSQSHILRLSISRLRVNVDFGPQTPVRVPPPSWCIGGLGVFSVLHCTNLITQIEQNTLLLLAISFSLRLTWLNCMKVAITIMLQANESRATMKGKCYLIIA